MTETTGPDGRIECPDCGGAGEIGVPARVPANGTSYTCPRCDGSGAIPPVLLDPEFQEESWT